MIDPGEVRGKIENWTKVSCQHNFDTCISKHVDQHMISDTGDRRQIRGNLCILSGNKTKYFRLRRYDTVRLIFECILLIFWNTLYQRDGQTDIALSHFKLMSEPKFARVLQFPINSSNSKWQLGNGDPTTTLCRLSFPFSPWCKENWVSYSVLCEISTKVLKHYLSKAQYLYSGHINRV